ncbi:MAG: dual specificity protein phosphatase family protein [Parcubacteria group bacterium]|nr:dual specificity protein phosphatase family protein [Parcubacteria group bacterium]
MIPHSQKKLDYNYITDGIYIGTNQCCQLDFAEALKKEGLTADISLEEERVDAPFGVNFYVWIPVKDHLPPTPDQMEFGVSVLEQLTSAGKKIYVHCKNGHGRAPTLVAAYLVKKGKSPEEAEALIKARRPSMHLEEVQREAIRNFNNKK